MHESMRWKLGVVQCPKTSGPTCIEREDVVVDGAESSDTADVSEGRNRDVGEEHGLVRILKKKIISQKYLAQ
mgnify:CR=1 FL=1